MTSRFIQISRTSGVEAAQNANGSGEHYAGMAALAETEDRLSDSEIAFIQGRDTFYMATVSESGWPYVQHRGGPAGFVRVIDERTLGFLDFRGNRQYISVGNVSTNDRAALIFMDYVHRRRLKIYAHIEIKALDADLGLTAKFAVEGYRAKPERLILLHLEAYDWNCPQHITPRFTAEEVEEVVQPLRDKISVLEAENRQLRAEMSGSTSR